MGRILKTKKIKFWDRESKIMLETSISVTRAFRNLMQVAEPPSFSSCDNKPNKDRYIPLLGIGKTDCNGVELWEGDIINFDYSMFRGDEYENKIKCVVEYDPTEAMFCINPIEEMLEVAMMPLIGLKAEIEVVGNIYNENFKEWLAKQGEGNINKIGVKTMRDIYDAMDAEDNCKH